jgi:osmoprotectant transport system ATP-binding protein
VAAIAFRDVAFAYPDGASVLAGLDLAVEPGDVLALVGRSGAGKSTLLRLVNRLALPDRGDVLVEGQATTAWDPIALRRRVGYVRQDVGLFPHLTVAENIGLLGRVSGWSEARVAARVGELLALVSLPHDLGGRWPDEISGGQRQRVGVARALLLDPPILLMDEPFGALDPVTRLDLHREFQRLQAQLGKTVLIVTHDLREALALAARIGVLDAGALVAIGGPGVLKSSAHPFVRSLVETLTERYPGADA